MFLHRPSSCSLCITAVAAALWALSPEPGAARHAQERPAREFLVPALVSAIAFSPDGQAVVAWDPAGFSMWNLQSGRLSSREPVFGKACGRASVLPRSEDGVTIGVICKGALVFFEVATGRPLGDWKLPEKQTPAAYSASANGEQAGAVVAGALTSVQLLDRAAGSVRALLRDEQEIETLSFSADCKWVATGSIEGLQVWDVAGARAVHRIPGGSSHAFSPDGRTIAVTGPEAGVFDVQSGTRVRELKPAASRLRFSPDGRFVVGWTNQQVTIWDAATGSRALVLKGDGFTSAAVSGDGTQVATTALEQRGNSAATALEVWRMPAALPLRSGPVLSNGRRTAGR